MPGGGKTTTLNKLQEIMKDIRVVNFGDIMLEIVKSKFGGITRDEIRDKIFLDQYRDLQTEAAKKISAMTEDLVIDTHAAVKSGYGYYPGLPSEVLETLQPHIILALEFRPEDVLARRTKDAGASVAKPSHRQRALESLGEIEEHQKVGREFAVAAANHAGCYARIMSYNYPQKFPFEHAAKAAEDIANIVRMMREKREKRLV